MESSSEGPVTDRGMERNMGDPRAYSGPTEVRHHRDVDQWNEDTDWRAVEAYYAPREVQRNRAEFLARASRDNLESLRAGYLNQNDSPMKPYNQVATTMRRPRDGR
jgi:hypothetical protein